MKIRFVAIIFYFFNFNYANAVDCVESVNTPIRVKLVDTGSQESDSSYYAKILKLEVGQEEFVGSDQILSLKEGYDLLQQISEHEVVLVTFQSDLKKAGEEKLKAMQSVAENKTPRTLLKIGDFLSNYNPWALADKFSGLGGNLNSIEEIENAKNEVREILCTRTIKVSGGEVQRTFVITKNNGELKFFLQDIFKNKWVSARELFTSKNPTPPGIISIKRLIP